MKKLIFKSPTFYITKLLILILVLSSCLNNNKHEQNFKVFRYNESAGVTSLDPAFARDQANIWVCNQLYNGLVQLDDKLKVIPCIAKSWEISKDGTTYIFNIRNDVYFHNSHYFKNNKGRKVVASDFVYSFNRIVDPQVASPGSWVFQNVNQVSSQQSAVRNQKSIYSFYAINDSTLKIELKEPFSPFLGLLTMQYCSVVPREIVEHFGKEFRKNPIGTGPFQLKIWKEGVKMVLLKNEKYFEKDAGNRLPFLDAVSITFIVEKQTAFLEFVKGNIDFISGIDPGYKDELLSRYGTLNAKYRNKFNLSRSPYLNVEYLGFMIDNKSDLTKNNPLRLKAVRQAINYGIDRKKMIRYLRNNIGKPGTNGIIPPGLPSYDSLHQRGYDYQPEKAKQLLIEAGYPNGINLPEITLSTTSSYLDLCKYMQQQLAEIGIKLKIDVSPPGTLREMIAKSKISFFRGSWIADYPDAENYLSLFYTPNFCPKGPNYTHFSDKTFDDLYEKSRKEQNDSIRYNYYKEMDELIINEAPVVILYYDEVLRFTQKNIEGLGNNPLNLLTLKRVRKSN